MSVKSRLIVVCLIVLPFLTFAQSSYLGLRTGYHVASFKASEETADPIELSQKPAIDIALVIGQKADESWMGFSVEPGYMLKGSKISSSTLDYRLHYLSLPVLVDLYPIERVKISAGPEIGYLASARNEVNDTTVVSIRKTYDKRWELSGTVGISVSPTYFLDLGVRYNQAFTKAAALDAIIERRNIYNRYLQFFVVWKIWN